MKLYELLDNVEIQCEYKIVYYDYEKEERIELNQRDEDIQDCDIFFIYTENDCIFIELYYYKIQQIF